MVIKILIPIIIILVIFFIINYNKSYQENFSLLGKLEVTFSTKDSIFMISDNLNFVNQDVNGTTVHKNTEEVFSSKAIHSEDGDFSGVLFSIEPNKKAHIGFSNLGEDKKNRIAYGINIVDNDVFEIVEKITDTSDYKPVDIDYCLDGSLDVCAFTKTKFKFDAMNNMLAMIINQGKIHYMKISKNEEGEYGAMLIHIGKNKVKYPINLKIICNSDKVLFPTLLWTRKYLTYDSPMFWSVETKFKDQYENEPLNIVPMPSFTQSDEEISSSPTDEESDEIDFSKYFDVGTKNILIRNFCRKDNNLSLDLVHNLTGEDMQYYKGAMFLRIFEEKDKYLRVPISDINILDNFNLNDISYKKKIFSLQILVGNIVSNNFLNEKSNCDETTKNEAPY